MDDSVLMAKLLEPSVFLSLGFLVLLGLGIVSWAVSAVLIALFRERSRRDIAAYIAEGSLSAEQGVDLMKARGRASSS